MTAPDPSTTMADPSAQVAEQLLRLTRKLQRAQKRYLDPIGITPAQARLLRALSHHDRESGPPRMADLAGRLEVVPRAVTTLVDALEANGAVRRVPDPVNRRVIRVELTEEGRQTLRALREARRGAVEEILAPLTAERRAALGGLLAELLGGGPAPCGD